ncbi:hypothetical protein HYV74_05015 [Candidatus Uhrbacteria bacterium]|nr:hypothetical protein [Candidatus Uhrbacteria bacterium]
MIRIRAADAPPPGVTVVVLTVDPSNSIPELDEAQNSVTLPIPEMPLPDFVVTELTKRPDSGRLRATIRNRGSRAWSGALGISFAPKNAAGQAQWGATVTQLPTSTQLAANDGMVTFDLNVALDASARTVDVTIDNGNAAVEQDERNTFTFPVPKPDYVVEGVAADVATGELLVTGTAAGEGSVGVRFTYTDGAQTVGRNGTATQADATQLLPNATQVVRIGVADIPPPGAVSTTMTVDPNNAIPELDEQNNEASFPLPSMVYPDFVVTGLTTQPSNGRLRATIQNNGSRAWSGALGIIFTPKNAAGQAQWGGIATQLPASTQIPANGGTATFDLSVAVNAATKTVDVTIDNGNVVVEQDERNTFTFPVPKPDYVVEQAVRDPATGDLLITIRNVGTAAARGSIGVRFGYQRGSQRVGRTGTASQSNAPILLPDATQLIRIHGTNAPPPEATSATLFVDPTNIVVELDEQNTRPFSIR